MEKVTIFELGAILSPLVTMLFAYYAFRHNQRGDDSTSAREMGTILTEIGYIKSQMDSLNRKFEQHEERYGRLSERMAAMEQSVKSAHHRIDTIMEGVVFKDEKR
jgi:chromosome segregation ATPase